MLRRFCTQCGFDRFLQKCGTWRILFLLWYGCGPWVQGIRTDLWWSAGNCMVYGGMESEELAAMFLTRTSAPVDMGHM